MTQKIIPIAIADSRNAPLLLIEPSHKVYVRAVSGWFATWRWALVWFTQLVFFGLPWVSWHGRQAVLFDLVQQRFYLFGLVLYPQDLIYLAVLLMLSALTLFFVTAVAGRVWCGYACPQTVYTEMFLWVEHLTEGKPHARKALDKQSWGAEKVIRKGAKQTLWLALSLGTGFTFVGYFTPIQDLAAALSVGAMGPWDLFWVLFYALATYLNAGYLREQVCKHMCPYARFQAAMFDQDTLIIGYDSARGESRGARARTANAKALGLGDCVNCSLCVQVCPTGIDIREGLQSTCIGCAACIDACDSVMDQMQYPRGLIRYSTLNGLTHGWDQSALLKRVLRPRVLMYGTLLLVASVSLVISIGARSPVRLDVVRDRSVIARVVNDGAVENIYRLHLMNATEAVQHYRVKVLGPEGLALVQALDLNLNPVQAQTYPVSVHLPATVASTQAGQILHIKFAVNQLVNGQEVTQVLEGSTFYVPQ
jgi:cytochrome c oxidase accessory protein FixG